MKLFGIAALALAASFAAAPAMAWGSSCIGGSCNDNSVHIKVSTVQIAGSHAVAVAKNGFYNKAIAIAPSKNVSITKVRFR